MPAPASSAWQRRQAVRPHNPGTIRRTRIGEGGSRRAREARPVCESRRGAPLGLLARAAAARQALETGSSRQGVYKWRGGREIPKVETGASGRSAACQCPSSAAASGGLRCHGSCAAAQERLDTKHQFACTVYRLPKARFRAAWRPEAARWRRLAGQSASHSRDAALPAGSTPAGRRRHRRSCRYMVAGRPPGPHAR